MSIIIIDDFFLFLVTKHLYYQLGPAIVYGHGDWRG